MERLCVRCNIPMINKLQDKKGKVVELKPYVYADGRSILHIGTNDKVFVQTYSSPVKIAICPLCGEISFYLDKENLDELFKKR